MDKAAKIVVILLVLAVSGFFIFTKIAGWHKNKLDTAVKQQQEISQDETGKLEKKITLLEQELAEAKGQQVSEEKLAEVFGEKNKPAEVTADQKELTEVMNEVKKLAAKVQDEKDLAEVLRDSKKLTASLGEDSKLVEVMRKDDKLARVLQDEKKLGEILQDENKLASYGIFR